MKKQIILLAITTGIIFMLTFSVQAQHYHGHQDGNKDSYSNQEGYAKHGHHQDHYNNGQCGEDTRRAVVYHSRVYPRPNYCASRQVIMVRNTCRPSYCQPRPRCGTLRY